MNFLYNININLDMLNNYPIIKTLFLKYNYILFYRLYPIIL